MHLNYVSFKKLFSIPWLYEETLILVYKLIEDFVLLTTPEKSEYTVTVIVLGSSSLPLNNQEKKVLNYLTKKLWKDIIIFLF